jgi:hypothetical protein
LGLFYSPFCALCWPPVPSDFSHFWYLLLLHVRVCFNRYWLARVSLSFGHLLILCLAFAHFWFLIIIFLLICVRSRCQHPIELNDRSLSSCSSTTTQHNFMLSLPLFDGRFCHVLNMASFFCCWRLSRLHDPNCLNRYLLVLCCLWSCTCSCLCLFLACVPYLSNRHYPFCDLNALDDHLMTVRFSGIPCVTLYATISCSLRLPPLMMWWPLQVTCLVCAVILPFVRLVVAFFWTRGSFLLCGTVPTALLLLWVCNVSQWLLLFLGASLVSDASFCGFLCFCR